MSASSAKYGRIHGRVAKSSREREEENLAHAAFPPRLVVLALGTGWAFVGTPGEKEENTS